jgi:hypothetical protein
MQSNPYAIAEPRKFLVLICNLFSTRYGYLEGGTHPLGGRRQSKKMDE